MYMCLLYFSLQGSRGETGSPGLPGQRVFFLFLDLCLLLVLCTCYFIEYFHWFFHQIILF